MKKEEYPRPLIKAVLKLFLEPISGIHGECYVCIDLFIEDANKKLEGAGLPWQYVSNRAPDYNVTLEIR